MDVVYRKQFTKHLRERIKPDPALYKRFKERMKLFIKTPEGPILEDHQLTGDKMNFRAFSITGDVRVVYHQGEDYIYFIDVGTHNQVY